MAKGRHKIDLDAYLLACELNYLRLIKLLPGELQDNYRFSIELPGNHSSDVVISVTERCKYTTMLQIEQQSDLSWLNHHLELRLYHDVKSCDITAFQGHRNLWPVYDYPNQRMYQPDEKEQQQHYLTRLLGYCLDHGYGSASGFFDDKVIKGF